VLKSNVCQVVLMDVKLLLVYILAKAVHYMSKRIPNNRICLNVNRNVPFVLICFIGYNYVDTLSLALEMTTSIVPYYTIAY